MINIGTIEKVCSECTGRYCAKKVSIFSILQNEQLAEVVKKVVTKTYKKNQIIFFQGDIADRLYIVNKGKSQVFLNNILIIS